MLSEVTRYGELESRLRLPRMRMVARQPIHRDFTEIGFQGVLRRGELESSVRFCWMTLVARQQIQRDFTGIRLPGLLRHGEVDSEIRLPRSASVDREPMKIDFAENTFPLGISMWERWIFVQLSGQTRFQRCCVESFVEKQKRHCDQHGIQKDLWSGFYILWDR